MPASEFIEESIRKLINYIESQSYSGYDPYDALKSPLFKLPVLRSNKLIRFGFQQLLKRFPVNLRPVLGVPKGYNPVTLGLCIQGYSYMAEGGRQRAEGTELRAQGAAFAEASADKAGHRAQGKESFSPSPSPPVSPSETAQANRIPNTEYRIPITFDEYTKRIEFLINELKSLIPPGYHGACWGYDFDWEARYASIPAYQPTVVATGIITNALYIALKTTDNKDCAELIKSSAFFVLNDLKRTCEGEQFIFSYSPLDNQQVFNASMKGVRILAQAYELTGDENLKNEAKNAAEYVVSKQQSDGSWGYSLDSKGGWTDNYHSGYVLDCLDVYTRLCHDEAYKENLSRGYQFYKDHFIEKDGMPRFFASKAYPVDCTAAAQTILTLNRFGDKELAVLVAGWIIKNMQSETGSFYFRKYKYFTNKTSFMRWSDAWMFAALASLVFE